MKPLSLLISGIGLQLESSSHSLLERLKSRYGDFTSHEVSSKPFPVVVEVETGGKAREYPAPEAAFEGDRIVFDLPGYAGYIDPALGARVRISAESPENGADYFLRVVTSALAYRAGGLMIHAAGIIREARAFIFFGPSGSGKTTVARSVSGDQVLNDDLIVLMPRAGRWYAGGTPFTHPAQVSPSADSAPAAALLRLVQSPRLALEPLVGAKAVAELVACVPILNGSLTPPLDRCREILNSLPAYDLHLQPEPSFWDLVDRIA